MKEYKDLYVYIVRNNIIFNHSYLMWINII